MLPASLLNYELQLVFETINDSGDLSILKINNVSAIYQSRPRIQGTIRYRESGQIFAAVGASVLLERNGAIA